MCKVYNSIGSLTTIKSHLHEHQITEFRSLKELISFQDNFSIYRKQLLSSQELLIEEEKKNLYAEILQLDESIRVEKEKIGNQLQGELDLLKQELQYLLSPPPGNFFKRIMNGIKKNSLKRQIRAKERSLQSSVNDAIQELVNSFNVRSDRYKYLGANFAAAVNESCSVPLRELEGKKDIIDQLNTSIYGALGEQRVVREFEKLPDDYFLINDFTFTFQKPIYNPKNKDTIRSIQIDHLLISPAGIFLVETKNWSEESLNNLSLRSPVEQIKRHNFALFKILNGETGPNKLRLDQHHWGERKIPIRNLIVLTKLKPREEFQYVKILTVNELLGYIKYFNPCFSNTETRDIAFYLRDLVNAK